VSTVDIAVAWNVTADVEFIDKRGLIDDIVFAGCAFALVNTGKATAPINATILAANAPIINFLFCIVVEMLS
jgi:hypothetical protein